MGFGTIFRAELESMEEADQVFSCKVNSSMTPRYRDLLNNSFIAVNPIWWLRIALTALQIGLFSSRWVIWRRRCFPQVYFEPQMSQFDLAYELFLMSRLLPLLLFTCTETASSPLKSKQYLANSIEYLARGALQASNNPACVYLFVSEIPWDPLYLLIARKLFMRIYCRSLLLCSSTGSLTHPSRLDTAITH